MPGNSGGAAGRRTMPTSAEHRRAALALGRLLLQGDLLSPRLSARNAAVSRHARATLPGADSMHPAARQAGADLQRGEIALDKFEGLEAGPKARADVDSLATWASIATRATIAITIFFLVERLGHPPPWLGAPVLPRARRWGLAGAAPAASLTNGRLGRFLISDPIGERARYPFTALHHGTRLNGHDCG